MQTRGLLLAIAVVCAAGAPVSAQFALPRAILPPTPMDGRIERVTQWAKALDQHEAGTADDAAALVAGWTHAQLQALWIDASVVVQLMRNPRGMQFRVGGVDGRPGTPVRYTPEQLKRLKAIACAGAGIAASLDCGDMGALMDAELLALAARASESRLHGDANYLLRRGALLHGDIAMLITPTTGSVAPAGGVGPRRFKVEVQDGRTVGIGGMAIHWELARTLLDFVTPPGASKPAPARDEMVLQWYRATSAWMESRRDHDADHVERAVAMFPHDPELLLLAGAMHETFASPEIQAAVQSVVLGTGDTLSIHGERAELTLAEALLRRALAARPDYIEARLRHGRVLARLGRYPEAVEVLQRAAAVNVPLLRFYGHLFLGEALEALRQFDPARDAYLEAERLAPTAQSPKLALSALARRRGDRDGALRELQHVFDLPPDEAGRSDPWWDYEVAYARNTDALLEELWKPFRRAAP